LNDTGGADRMGFEGGESWRPKLVGPAHAVTAAAVPAPPA